MTDPTLSFMTRLVIAFRLFLRVLFDPKFGSAAVRLLGGEEAPAQAPAPALREAGPDAALQLLGLLQQNGRLVDFLEEEVAQYTDAEIGAAVRVVHEGCRKTLNEHFLIEPVRPEQEGARITLEPGYDAAAMRPTGNVVGEPPFIGTLTHRGWRVSEVKLPKLTAGHDTRVLALAEVEL